MDETLRELAAAYGVATEYWDWRGEHVEVAPATLTAVLAALDVDAATPVACAASLAAEAAQPWSRTLPHYVIARAGERRTVDVHVRHGAPLSLRIRREDGTPGSSPSQIDNFAAPREIDARLVGEASFELPDDLPPGYHTLLASTEGADHDCPLIVTPSWLGLPAGLGEQPKWGLAAQLYSACSRRSWGLGDLTDLADLAGWAAADHGADFVLVNPLHAAEPIAPMNPSPYLPTTRRFANPAYLRIEAVPEYAYLSDDLRAAVDEVGTHLRAELNGRGLIDRDTVWAAKRASLQLIWRSGSAPGRAGPFRAFCRREGTALDDFATWCVLVETHGLDWRDWPSELQHPCSPAVAAFRSEHADAVAFHRWLQWLVDEQLAGAQAAARRAGMRLGVVHDLAVGVSPTGADSWARQDELGAGITVGAPPDAYAQTGQDWRQPPWRPDRLAEQAYAPFRDLVRAVLRHAGGLRVDHVIGLFRLWWIPAGAAPTDGTYVHYDHDAMIGILALEAQRAGAVVIGEDLGTVEPWVRDYLRAVGILGTSILWFEFDWDGDGKPLAPERWREFCLAAVTTHDLPPSAGYLGGDHVRLRDRLGLLTRSLDEELAADRADQQAWLDELRRRGLLGEHADVAETVEALHRVLAQTPARLRCLALTDAMGERRTQNQPGTLDEYPNWRIPLADAEGRPVLLEDVFVSERAARLAQLMRG